MELQTIDYPGSAVIAAMGLEVLAYGQGSDAEPTDRVLIRLLAQAERALCAPGLFGPGRRVPRTRSKLQNTRRVLDHETEVGPPYRSLMSSPVPRPLLLHPGRALRRSDRWPSSRRARN